MRARFRRGELSSLLPALFQAQFRHTSVSFRVSVYRHSPGLVLNAAGANRLESKILRGITKCRRQPSLQSVQRAVIRKLY